MIEKMLKIVKSSNKRKGRNITIGAVIGFLLLCTGVMGADDNYLWIKEDGETIKFSVDTANGTDGEWNEKNPYEENSWDADTKTYVNNIIISGKENDDYPNKPVVKNGYGIKLEANGLNFINNNKISGNATTISGSSIKSYGIYVNSSITIENLKNIGIISSEVSSVGEMSGSGYGIYIDSEATIKNLENTGHIAGSTNSTCSGVGIYAEGVIENLINTGIIRTGTKGNQGIFISSGTTKKIENMGNITGASMGILAPGGIIENLRNTGSISAFSNLDEIGKAIAVVVNGTIKNLENTGTLIGNGSGVYVTGRSSSVVGTLEKLLNQGKIDVKGEYGGGVEVEWYGKINDFSNTGVIYGEFYAVYMNGAPISSTNNYGIFAGNRIIKNDKNLPVKNYGLYIAGATGIVTKGDQTVEGTDEKVIVTAGYDDSGNDLKREMVIKNAEITDGSGIGTTTESIELGTNNYNNHILNGKNDTLKVSGTGNEVEGSIINAYGSAVKFDTDGGELVLSGTIVNGGIDGATAISGSDQADTLILQSGEIKYTDGTINTQNTIINGNIDMGEGADNLVINSGTIVNGILNGGDASSKDTLNLGVESKEKLMSAIKEEINIHNNITNFENINIDANVTLFEKTIKNENLEITGVENITIGKDGTLTLRIDGTNNNYHALSSGNSSGTIDSEGGKLLLALNGVSDGSMINIGMNLGDGIYGVENKDIEYRDLFTLETTSLLHSLEKTSSSGLKITTKSDLPLSSDEPDTPDKPETLDKVRYEKLNKIYQSMRVVDGVKEFNVETQENLSVFTGYLNDIYAGNPYSYSSELSRKSMGMFRDIVTENSFKPELNKWMIYGGLTHVDGGTKDTYYGKGYYTYDIGSSDIEADTKITGAYMLGEYGISDTLTSGIVIGGNKLKSDLSNGSKADGDALYMGGYVRKYAGNLKVTAGLGIQYGDYDADRFSAGKGITETRSYSDNYNDMSYDIYLNGRYSYNIGENLFLEPYGTLSYTYIKQDSADEGNKTLAIETDSKSFSYTTAKVGVDLKKIIPHEKGKSTLSAGVSYTRLLNGADEEYITGRFKGGSDFDILVSHKNEHSIGLNAKYTLELENGILFDVKGSYAVERDSNNNSGKNKTKGEWIVGVGLGYKF